MAAVAALFVAVPVVGASCGDEGEAGATLPPIITTTSTSVFLTTTTFIARYYEVQSGDNLGNIADQMGVDMAELMRVNNITDANRIEVGQSLLIPAATVLMQTLPTG
jgi:LysM repeat protein